VGQGQHEGLTILSLVSLTIPEVALFTDGETGVLKRK
jgi:hypothetical protein